MRGRYFDTDYQETLRLTRQLPDLDSARCTDSPHTVGTDAPTVQNDPIGRFRGSPQVIPSTEAPSSFADVQAIVSHVAHKLLWAEVIQSEPVSDISPLLKGITKTQVLQAIAEALA